jgi:hypothetical protein
MANTRDRQAGLAQESDYIATTGSTVSSPKEFRARASWAGGMSFSTLCVRYDFKPEIALRVLGLDQRAIGEAEWYKSQLMYMEAKNPVRNELRDERDRDRKSEDRCWNPMRGGPRP